MNISHTIDHSLLRRETWEFWLTDDLELILDVYLLSERESTRKKNYTPINHFVRLDSRNALPIHKISRDDVPIPDEVIETVKQEIYSRVRLVRKYGG
jgi:hypothetical protein